MEDLEIMLALQNMVRETLKAVDKRIADSSSTIIVQGRVIEILGNDQYRVRINQDDYIAKSHFTHILGAIVYVITTNKKDNFFIIY